MIRFLTLLIILTTYGCALTTPPGTKELLDDISRDKAHQRRHSNQFIGKAVFLKVRAYPRVDGPNVYGKHWVLMKTGNEKIDVERMLDGLSARSE